MGDPGRRIGKKCIKKDMDCPGVELGENESPDVLDTRQRGKRLACKLATRW